MGEPLRSQSAAKASSEPAASVPAASDPAAVGAGPAAVDAGPAAVGAATPGVLPVDLEQTDSEELHADDGEDAAGSPEDGVADVEETAACPAEDTEPRHKPKVRLRSAKPRRQKKKRRVEESGGQGRPLAPTLRNRARSSGAQRSGGAAAPSGARSSGSFGEGGAKWASPRMATPSSSSATTK